MSRAISIMPKLVHGCFLLAAMAWLAAPSYADTLVVNHYYNSDIFTNDFGDNNPGDGIAENTPGTGDASLRTCIEEANAHEGPDTIIFAGSGVVKPFSPLPPLDDPTGGTIIIGNPDVSLEGDKINFVFPGANRSTRIARMAALKYTVDGEGQLVPLEEAGAETTAAPAPSTKAAFVVTNVNDDGPGSLRQAINDANLSPGADTITFSGTLNIQPGFGVIEPATPAALPPLNGGITIDGGGTVTLRGNLLTDGSGLTLNGDSNIVRGLTIVLFPGDGITVAAGTGNGIENCEIGTDGQNLELGNAVGIRVTSNGNTIQGANTVSGNEGDGIIIEGNGNQVFNATIGTDLNGNLLLPNGAAGILVSGQNNLIGAPGRGNDIAANTGAGIVLGEAGAAGSGSNNTVRGNLVGTFALLSVLANAGEAGIVIEGNDNIIGGPAGGAFNYIVGNTGHGISIKGNDNLVERNLIAGNGTSGISVTGTDTSGIRNTFTRNSIFFNTDIGIDLGDLANEDIPAPDKLVLIALDPATVQVQGNAPPNATIELFGDDEDEGEFFINSTLSAPNGFWTLDLNVVDFLEYNLTATATSGTGNTSEFSAPLRFSQKDCGLRIRSADNEVHDLSITGFPDGGVSVQTQTAINNLIQGCTFSGHELQGMTVLYGATSNLIGGAGAIYGNIISGNGTIADLVENYRVNLGNGVVVFGIGTDGNQFSGNTIQGNQNHGVLVHGGASENIIGGNVPGAGNTIISNGTPGTLTENGFGNGIFILGGTTQGNVVAGNFIGIDANSVVGTNIASAVAIESGSHDNIVGGEEEAARNVLSGNGTQFVGGAGVYINGSGCDRNQVLGNYIGTNVDGTGRAGNWSGGVRILENANDNVVGSPDNGNLISGNDSRGVAVVAAFRTVIQGNFIGTNAGGTGAVANLDSGIALSDGAMLTLIGGTGDGEGNVISGNIDDGIVIYDEITTENTVEGNLIGTDATGTFAVPNTVQGVFITRGAFNNLIGGSEAAARNVISGNAIDGVRIARPLSDQNRVQGNYIGTDIDRLPILGNGLSGEGRGVLIIDDPMGNLIGGLNPGEGNIITNHPLDGVEISGANTLGNMIRANSIYVNEGNGIALSFSGNADMPAPELIGIAPLRGTTQPNAGIDLFIDSEDEGRTYLGTADADGTGAFALDVSVVDFAGFNLTATATDTSGNTSPFSEPLLLEAPEISGQPEDLVVVEGEPWDFTVVATGTETIFYQWQYSPDGVSYTDVADAGFVTGSELPTVESSSALLADEGFYRCIADNGLVGPVTSSSAHLTVIPANLATGVVDTLEDVNDGDTDTIAQLTARPGADGSISLREAIIAANNTPNANTILFDVSGAIEVASALPSLSDASGGTTIDGAGTVAVDGNGLSGAVNGFNLLSEGNGLTGLIIINFPQHGVNINGLNATGNSVKGCFIGNDGIDAGANAQRGVRVAGGASSNIIGGTATSDRNIIGGNGTGGIHLTGATTTSNVVAGNYIGTDSTGRLSLGNLGSGIEISGGANTNVIGGSNVGARNVISSNTEEGILITGAGATANLVQGNYVGTDVNGDPLLGNTSHGLLISGGAAGNRIGGEISGQRNAIAGNGGHGVVVTGATTLTNTLRQNSIHANSGRGIALLNDGNATLEAPVLNGVGRIINTTLPNATVDVFIDNENEGRIFFETVAANATGEFHVNPLLQEYDGLYLTATATVGGNTSEFSAALALLSPEVLEQPADIRRVEGEPFSLTVEAEGTPALNYQWQFSGNGTAFTDLANGAQFSGVTTDTLLSPSARLEDAGFYRCIVENGIGEIVFTDAAELVVVAASTADASVNTLEDAADGNTSSIAHIIAYPGADGQISLREAILAANNGNGPNAVLFDIDVAGAITPASALPAISDNSGGLTLDGDDVIVIDGGDLNGAESGLRITSSDNVVRGLQIVHFPASGIVITGGQAFGNIVSGNFLGNDGTLPRANGADGITIEDGAAANVIGGDASNVISGNAENGVRIAGNGADANVVQGNLIGCDATGTSGLANGQNGVLIEDGAADNIVGGSFEDAANVISGNNENGVEILDAGFNGVFGNYIGVDLGGASALGNTMSGVSLGIGASDNSVGGNSTELGNVISRNGAAGVFATGGTTVRNTIRGNSIVDNDGDGILLENGANSGIAVPEITDLGSVDGTAAPGSTVEIFLNDPGDSEGETLLDVAVANGAGLFHSPVNLDNFIGMNLTVTTTDTQGNTSEFGESLVVDLDPPVITLAPPEIMTLECGQDTYFEPGATALDDVDGDISRRIEITIQLNGGEVDAVDTSAPGIYHIFYNVTDTSGKPAEEQERLVTVRDAAIPVINLLGAAEVTLECRANYVDAGAVASDECAGDLTGSIVVNNEVNTSLPGTYTVSYNVTDPSGNFAITVSRQVIVRDTGAPRITLAGSGNISITVGTAYVDPGVSASDTCDTALPAVTIDTSGLNTSELGTYIVQYSVADAAGNEATAQRVVRVIDDVRPQIVLLGAAVSVVECGGTFEDPGATASDNFDGDVTARLRITGRVDTDTPDVYQITYDVSDLAGNEAVTVIRSVRVEDKAGPEITLLGAATLEIQCNSVYDDAGAIAADVCEGDVTSRIRVNNQVDTSVSGSYTVTYTLTDSAGNAARPVTRTVRVADCTNDCEQECVNAEQIDVDGDGLIACIEECFGSSDQSVDSDGDNLPDPFEFENNLNPTRDDSNADADGDSLLNFDEFLRGSLANNVNSPARSFFISPSGSDSTGHGTQNSPWQTIGFAIAQTHSTSANPARIVLADGLYTEDVVMVPGLILSGAVDEAAEIQGMIFGAANSALEYVSVLYTGREALLVMDNVPMHVKGVFFQGDATLGGTGILVTGTAPRSSIIEDSVFTQLSIGIDIYGGVPIIRRCRFELLATAGIILREGALDAGTALGSTEVANTGWNTFTNLEGLAVINLSDHLAVMEYNDWGTGDPSEILALIGLSPTGVGVDFQPFLAPGSAANAAQVYVLLWNSANQNSLLSGEVTLSNGAFESTLSGSLRGIYAFGAVPEGNIRVQAFAEGYGSETANIFVAAGERTTLVLPLTTIPKEFVFLNCGSGGGEDSSRALADLLVLTIMAGLLGYGTFRRVAAGRNS